MAVNIYLLTPQIFCSRIFLVFLCGTVLSRDYYTRDTLTVAKELIGCKLVLLHKPISVLKSPFITLEASDIKASGTIVETEAYLGINDKACHSYKAKPQGRTNIMYGEGGYAYVYLVYGMYNCFNAVTEKKGVPEAVLIRALEGENPKDKRFSGPGKLCRETGITREDYGADLCAQTPSKIIIIKPTDYKNPQITAAKRIGINYSEEAADYLYRFYNINSFAVSKK